MYYTVAAFHCTQRKRGQTLLSAYNTYNSQTRQLGPHDSHATRQYANSLHASLYSPLRRILVAIETILISLQLFLIHEYRTIACTRRQISLGINIAVSAAHFIASVRLLTVAVTPYLKSFNSFNL